MKRWTLLFAGMVVVVLVVMLVNPYIAQFSSGALSHHMKTPKGLSGVVVAITSHHHQHRPPPGTTLPPPSGTCEQGTTSPECQKAIGPTPGGPPVDCATSPSDPSCKPTGQPTPRPVDCSKNPQDPSCNTTTPPPVDCKAN